MRGLLIVLVAVLLTSHPAPIAARQAPGPPSPSVAVFVTVTDADRRVVPGLTADDFQLLDNGKPQAISAVDQNAGPVSVVLLIDTSGSMKAVLETAKTAAEAFLDNLAAGDMALVGGFAEKATFNPAVGFTRDRSARKAGLHQLPPGFPSGLYDALSESIDRLASQPGRRAVVVMTDGEDNVSRSNARRVATKAAVAGVSVWSIGIVNEYDPGQAPVNMATGQATPSGVRIRTKPDRGLEPLSENTGGAFVVLKNVTEWGPAFTTMAQALARPYVVRFSPAVVDGKTHKLEVRVKPAGRTVLAPKTYKTAKASPQYGPS